MAILPAPGDKRVLLLRSVTQTAPIGYRQVLGQVDSKFIACKIVIPSPVRLIADDSSKWAVIPLACDVAWCDVHATARICHWRLELRCRGWYRVDGWVVVGEAWGDGGMVPNVLCLTGGFPFLHSEPHCMSVHLSSLFVCGLSLAFNARHPAPSLKSPTT